MKKEREIEYLLTQYTDGSYKKLYPNGNYELSFKIHNRTSGKTYPMKTPTKKKAVKKVKPSSASVHTLYELYRTKSGAWKFRKRARNGEILNHSYNSKALAINGMIVDFELTKEMSELKWKEVKK